MSFIPAKIQIQKFILVESGTYNTQFRRSYWTGENEGTAVDELRDRLAGRRVMGAGSVAGFAGQIVNMNAKPDGELNIDLNGWNCRRFLYMMSVDIYAQGSVLPNRQIIMGWSENSEMSLQGSIDPQMRFTINSIVSLRQVDTVSQGRRITKMVPIDCSHVLSNQAYSGLNRTSEMRIDPYDVMGLMMVGKGLYQEEDDAPLYNYAGIHGKTPTKVQRKFAQPASYLAGILKGFGDAVSSKRNIDTNLPCEVDHATLCTTAQSFVSGSTASNDGFMMAVRSVAADGYLTNYFTLRDLSVLQPSHPMETFLQGDTRENTRVETRSRYSKAVLGEEAHETGSTNPWSGNDVVTQFAAIVSQGLPGLMMELFFTEVHFRATNETQDGNILIELMAPPNTFEKFDSRQFAELFEERVATDILRDACKNGMITFDLECRCDIITETWIDICLGGGESKTFNTPTFCDSLMTPMLSNPDNANGLANDMNTIVSDIVLGDNQYNAKNHGVISGYDDMDRQSNNRSNNGSPFRIII